VTLSTERKPFADAGTHKGFVRYSHLEINSEEEYVAVTPPADLRFMREEGWKTETDLIPGQDIPDQELENEIQERFKL